MLADKLREILIEFAERCYEAEEGHPVPPPDEEVVRAGRAIIDLFGGKDA